jgi:hypothetical protein
LLTILIHRFRVARAERLDRAPEAIVYGLAWSVWGEHGLGSGEEDEFERPVPKTGEEKPDEETLPLDNVDETFGGEHDDGDADDDEATGLGSPETEASTSHETRESFLRSFWQFLKFA